MVTIMAHAYIHIKQMVRWQVLQAMGFLEQKILSLRPLSIRCFEMASSVMMIRNFAKDLLIQQLIQLTTEQFMVGIMIEMKQKQSQ
mgnify:CR=1 FL=1